MGKNDHPLIGVPAPQYQNTVLNDSTWEAFLFLLVTSDTMSSTEKVNSNYSKVTQIPDIINNGSRQRFSVLQKSDIIAWAIENNKTNEICKEIKTAQDTGTEINDFLLAKLLKVWLISEKSEGVENKSKSKDGDDSGERKSSARGKSGKTRAAIGTGKDKKQEDEGDKKKIKLRDRGPGRADAKFTIDDEPIDGPDAYYLLKDFDNISTIAAFMDDGNIPIGAIIKATLPESQISDKPTSPKIPNPFYQGLKNASKTGTDYSSYLKASSFANENSYWKRCCWSEVSVTEAKDTKEMFDLVASNIYKILEIRKSYDATFEKDVIVNMNQDSKSKLDLRFYDIVADSLCREECNQSDVLFGVALEHITRAVGEVEAESYLVNDDLMELSDYFDKAVSKLSTFNESYSLNDKGLDSKRTNGKLCHMADTHGLMSHRLECLSSFGISPLSFTSSLRDSSYLSRYLKIFASLSPENLRSIERERTWKRGSIQKKTGISSKIADAALLQLAFSDLIGRDKVNIGEWTWTEELSRSALLQTIGESNYSHSNCKISYSPYVGLIVAMTGPGNVGDQKTSQKTKIQIKTKIGFGQYYDLVITQSRLLSLFTKTDTKKICYLSDIIVYHDSQNFVTYYEDGSSLQSVKNNTDLKLGADQYSCYKWEGGNVLTWAKLEQRNRYSMNLSLADGYAMTNIKENDEIRSYISTPDSYQIEFLKDESILIRPPRYADDKEELSRIITKEGIVIRYLLKDNIQILFPNGNVAQQNNKQDWSCTRDDGKQMTMNSKGELIAEKSLKYSKLVDVHETKTVMFREDLVSTILENENVLVKHIDGTKIDSLKDQYLSISKKNYPTIRLSSKGTTVHFANGYEISKERVNYVFSAGDNIFDICLNGKISAKSIIKNENIFSIDWLLPSSLEKKNISRPYSSEIDSQPIIQDTNHSVYNLPKLFLVREDGTGIQLWREGDTKSILNKYTRDDSLSFYEEKCFESGHIITLMKRLRLHTGSMDGIIMYRQFNKFDNIENLQFIIQQYLPIFDGEKDSRNADLTFCDVSVSEIFASNDSVSNLNGTPIVFGKNKEETEEFLTKHVLNKFVQTNERNFYLSHPEEIQPLSQKNSGVIFSLLAKPKAIPDLLKIARNSRKATPATSQGSKAAVIMSLQKDDFPSYFESPEGKSFLKSVETNISRNVEDMSPPLEQLLKEESICDVNTANSIAPTVLTDNHRDLSFNSQSEPTNKESEVATVNQKSNSSKQRKKLSLPSSIIGSKPGAIPNSKFLAVESTVRRKLSTASTVALRKGLPPDLGTFEVHPAKIVFANVESEKEAKFSLRIRNVGIDSSRFRAQLPKDSIFTVSYKSGPIAPGMSSYIDIILRARKDLKVSINEELKIITESEILHVPIIAEVQ